MPLKCLMACRAQSCTATAVIGCPTVQDKNTSCSKLLDIKLQAAGLFVLYATV